MGAGRRRLRGGSATRAAMLRKQRAAQRLARAKIEGDGLEVVRAPLEVWPRVERGQGAQLYLLSSAPSPPSPSQRSCFPRYCQAAFRQSGLELQATAIGDACAAPVRTCGRCAQVNARVSRVQKCGAASQPAKVRPSAAQLRGVWPERPCGAEEAHLREPVPGGAGFGQPRQPTDRSRPSRLPRSARSPLLPASRMVCDGVRILDHVCSPIISRCGLSHGRIHR